MEMHNFLYFPSILRLFQKFNYTVIHVPLWGHNLVWQVLTLYIKNGVTLAFQLILFHCIHLVYTAFKIHTSSVFFLHNNNYYKWFITILYSYFSFDGSSSRQPSWSQSAPYVTTSTSSMAVSRTLMANSTCVRLAAPGWGLPCCSVK